MNLCDAKFLLRMLPGTRRDISPSNLVLVEEGGAPRLVLLDLHVARGPSGGGTDEPEKITGKWPYLALRLMYNSSLRHTVATDLESGALR